MSRTSRTILLVPTAMLLCVVALFGAGALSWRAVVSPWHTNIGNVRLLSEWEVYRGSVSVARCARWTEESAAGPVLEKALKANPINERALLSQGRRLWLEGRCLLARDTWRQAIELRPQDRFAEWELANQLFAEGKRIEAVELYRHYQAGPYFLVRGWAATARGDMSEALEALVLSFLLERSRSTAHSLATYYITYEQATIKAKRVWEELAAATASDNPDHWWAKGQMEEIDERWSEALVNYDRSLEMQTHPYLLYLGHSQAGQVAIRAHEFVAAERHLGAALALQPDNILSLLRLGELFQEQGNYGTALWWYQLAEHKDPTSELPPYYIGTLEWKRGALSEAQRAFERAEAKNSKSSSVKFYLALLTYQSGNLQAATVLLENAIELHSGPSMEWRVLLGNWYVQAGDCTEADRVIRELQVSYPGQEVVQDLGETAREMCP